MAIVVVMHSWNDEYGACYECGDPAAFSDGPKVSPEMVKKSDKLCAVCAANEAALGVPIRRIDEM